jgi:quinol monooxygenase YgiN
MSRSTVDGPVTVLAQFIAKPDRAAAVREALLRVVEPARAEPGNTRYDVHQLKNNPGGFYVLATWADQGALDAHLTSAHVRSILGEQVADDIVAPPMLIRTRMLSKPDEDPQRPRPVANSAAQVTLVPFFTIRPGQVDAVQSAHLSMIDPTRAEPGCLDYDLYQPIDDPSVMFFYENWTDQAALDQHMNTPNFYRVVRGEIDPRLVVPWTAHLMTMVSQPDSAAASTTDNRRRPGTDGGTRTP